MKKIQLIVAAAAVLTAGSAMTDTASARHRGDRGAQAERNDLTASQIAAQEDARTARIKADLRLTPDQEKIWPALETALRDIGKTRAERQVSFQTENTQQKKPGSIIEHLNKRATFLADRSADLKKLADAAGPLYDSLDDQQKKRFAGELIRLSRGQDSGE